MNAPAPVPDIAAARKALARSIGLAAFVYGYPLTETYRTCALQTAPRAERRSGASAGSDVRAPLNTLHHAPRPSTHEDRDVVTPANDLLYTMAWLHLAHGPMLLTVPASARHPGRYFVLPLYDAYTENFENLGPRNCNPEGETVVLVGPGGTVLQGRPAAIEQWAGSPCSKAAAMASSCGPAHCSMADGRPCSTVPGAGFSWISDCSARAAGQSLSSPTRMRPMSQTRSVGQRTTRWPASDSGTVPPGPTSTTVSPSGLQLRGPRFSKFSV